jgi:7-cyano-7-deazaguanine synthase in queuosine biosynthesis
MPNERLILCGPAQLTTTLPVWRRAPRTALQIGTGSRDVHVEFEQLTRRTCAGLPPVAADLIDLAAFVYSADQAVPRGGGASFDYGESWRRHFRFEVAVRCSEVWSQPGVNDALVDTLTNLSGDDFEFAFCRHPNPRPMEGYLYGKCAEPGTVAFDEVLLFSGGLDSLGGAVLEAVQGGRKIALVSHRPTAKIYSRQRDLAKAVADKVPDQLRKPLHVGVTVNKGKVLSRDFNQRTRSFLFLSLAAVVARALGVSRLRAYENGVVSLNLPISAQLLGGRASRSTHPRTLEGFGRLCSLLFESNFNVQNPFLWQTKTEVLSQVRGAGHGRLCAMAVSCGGTIAATRQHSHCGRCSQCVDRRLTALAAGLDGDEDPARNYASDVLTGPRDGTELTLIERYLGTALQVTRMKDPKEFLRAFPEVTRAITRVGLPAAQALHQVIDLYRRHSGQVCDALASVVKEHSAQIVGRNIPANCLLSLACGRRVTPRAAMEAPTSAATETKPLAELFRIDCDRFQVIWANRACYLGNSMELRLLVRLNQSRDSFIAVETLADEVWDNAATTKNTIQTTVSNLRRRLRSSALSGVIINGQERGHYRLEIRPDVDQASA